MSFSSEAHPDVIEADGLASAEGYQSDLAYLKSKVGMHPFYSSKVIYFFSSSRIELLGIV